MHACSTASGGAGGTGAGGSGQPYGSQVSVGSTGPSRQRPRGHGGMLAGDNKNN